LLLHKSQAQWIGIDDTRVREQVRPDAERALLSGRSTSSPYQLPDGRFHAFIEIIHPPIRLTIFGAGASAVPLVTCAKALGWQVTVVDARSTFLTEERFPEADRLLLYHPEEVVSSLQLSDRDVAVLMTHNYAHDAALLRFLLPSPVRYIGLLGPKRKGEMILEDLRKEGRAATGPQVQRLFNPVGIDLGAEEGEEIALAIVAEIQAVLAGRPAGFLRDRTDPIHG
jgi:xanthine/CO dehydrogenase XdhC/CoxF family maturation factor